MARAGTHVRVVSIAKKTHNGCGSAWSDGLYVDSHVTGLLGRGALSIDCYPKPGCCGVVETDVKGQDRLVNGLG